ncbi:porin family protein [Sulfurovum sp. XGS-02]|uniref:porin family protein n=1 Tax=Sulfurovum sp. XGS-02 TaxID=2925411 RepID=UPI002063F187|nr:porin family protein [Sulfurovum sp. XGS-02]UPT78219.1 porin family protein [Sulfurovum sp. XGS-02]
MKKTLVAAALSAHLTTQLFAGGDIAPVEVHEPVLEEAAHAHHEESKFYLVVAGMTLLGDEIHHGEALLDGDDEYGYGFGIDIGYRLGNGFAIEYDYTYGKNTVYEITAHETVEATSTYYTSAIDIVYTYEATHNLGIFGKVGYEFEWEKITELDIDEREDDFVFGAGVEYALNKEYKLLVEYEHSLIEGPHGDAILAGVMLNF